MDGSISGTFSGGDMGKPLFDRIGALAYEIASGGCATPYFDRTDIRVGAKAQEVVFPGAGTAISE